MLDKLLFQFVGKAKKYIFVSVLLMMLRVVGTTMIAFSLGFFFDYIIHQSEHSFTLIIALFAIGVICRVFALQHVTQYQSNIIGEVKRNIRKEMITLTATFHVAMTGVAAGKKLIELFELPEIDYGDNFDVEKM